MEQQYLVGIDLGTTNTVVYYIDKSNDDWQSQVFNIPQITALGEMSEKNSLPSFIYLAEENEVASGALNLPWSENLDYSIGEFAKQNASKSPQKTVSSSKSWLCTENVNRKDDILPWKSGSAKKKYSPVKSAELILKHVKAAWNDKFTQNKLEDQQVILTIPASFDIVARELTVEAAKSAGLNVTLLEEPQAAFYSWLHEEENTWRDQIEADDTILVCDIGGGTTDFSLIQVHDSGGNLELERVAVGQHILLGGDNMDLALAYTLAAQLKSEKKMNLDQYQINGLTHGCRLAKEELLTNENAEPQTLTVLGRGSSLIGGTISVELTKDVVEEILLNGFLPLCPLDSATQKAQKSGLRNIGLEYATDAAITKHLAEFLSKHSTPETLPTKVLFNGGVSKSDSIKSRIIENLSNWTSTTCEEIAVLTGTDPDLAVAKGGCWYAAAKEGQGIRIKSGSSHSFYIGIESSMPAIPGFTPPLQGLCAVSLGQEDGPAADIPYSGLGLIVGEVTEFRFFSTTTRADDELGNIIDDIENCEDLEEIPSLIAELPIEGDIAPGSLVPITLQCELTEIGTLQLWCVSEDGENRWKLEFELRESNNN